ncbi:MAG TPA: hypothetical protein PKW06_05935 [Cyclobacteriaceae bacterium]|nr:hypothetical protein [Cyclobacteriaceae bacterium]
MENPDEWFKGQFVGVLDRNGKQIHEGDSVRFYHKGRAVVCRIVYAPEWAMFCLQWPDGYRNKFPLNPERYEVVE